MEFRVATETAPDLPWSWERLLSEQLDGQDPTATWRAGLAAGAARAYGAAVAPAMPAAFVLQWILEVAAEAGVYAAVHHCGVVHPREAGLTFALHPSQLYPVVAQVREVIPTDGGAGERLSAAWSAFHAAAPDLAGSYRPGVNLGSHQRLAMVDDVWAMVLARTVGQRAPARRSCCYIYVLPGAHECSGCPRLRAAHGQTRPASPGHEP